jgi:hypothetical protein
MASAVTSEGIVLTIAGGRDEMPGSAALSSAAAAGPPARVRARVAASTAAPRTAGDRGQRVRVKEEYRVNCVNAMEELVKAL